MTARMIDHSSPRLPALDAARGMAMILVCLSHFSWSASQTLGETRTFLFLITISMIATPTFILVSGVTLGYMYAGGGDAYRDFAAKVRERGLLLLTAAHLVMIPAFRYMAPTPRQALRVLPVTTTIGICLLVGPAVVVHMSRRGRIILGAMLIIVTWLLLFAWPADSQETAFAAVRDALVGTRRTTWWFYSYPVIPWLGVYLFGSAVGEDVRAGARNGRTLHIVVLQHAVWVVALGLFIEVLVDGLAALRPTDQLLLNLSRSVANPLAKLPPSPAYLLTYGAAALLLTALADLLLDRGWLRSVTNWLGDLGRSSLVVFVVQSYLYYMVVLHLMPPGRSTWPLYFLLSLAVVFGTAKLWLLLGGNRLLIVPGYARLQTWRAAHRALAGR